MINLFSRQHSSCVLARNDGKTVTLFYKIEQSHVHLTEFGMELFFFLKYFFSFYWILPQPLFLTNPLFPLHYTFVRFSSRCQMMPKKKL